MFDPRNRELLNTLRSLGSIEPDAASAQRAIARVRSQLANTPATSIPAPGVRWWRWSLAPALGLAAIVAFVWFAVSLSRPSVALADVVRALSALQSIRYSTSVDTGQGLAPDSRTIIAERTLLRTEYTSGRVYVLDRARGRSLSLYPAERRAVLRFGHLNVDDMFDVVDTLSQRFRFVRHLPQQQVDGVQAVGFVLTHKLGEYTLWVDPETKLLVRWESTTRDATGKITRRVHDKFLYGQPVDPALFDLTPPAGYRVEREGVPDLAPLLPDPQLQSPTLFVERGLGPVKFGMSLEEVTQTFGEPEEIEASLQSYRYPSRGIELFIGPRGVWGIMCRAQVAAPARIRDYSGKTDAGIGLGASAEQIIAAYGPPDKTVGPPQRETLSYDAHQLHFSLYEGRLVLIQHQGGR